jgi:hypothetical protein
MSLAIDENGVAKMILRDSVPSMDLDEVVSSETDSFDDTDFQILHSQANSFAFTDHDDYVDHSQPLNQRGYSHSKNSSHSTMGSMGSGIQPSYHSSASSYINTRKRPLLSSTVENDTMMEDTPPPGNAQAALRAIIEDRSRLYSGPDTAGHHTLHSSPPMVQTQYAMFNASPTTITDPELATPSTDRDSLASTMSTRCVCNSSVIDGTVPVVQWYELPTFACT